MTKQQLANKIWDSANKMRSKIEASEYKDYILGFIFYKFLSDKEVVYLKEKGASDEEIKNIHKKSNEKSIDYFENVRDNLNYCISYENLYSSWLESGSDFSVSTVSVALQEFSDSLTDKGKEVFEGIFKTLETGLSKLGTNIQSQTKAIRDLLFCIKEIPTDGKDGYDVLGFVYEFLLKNFASSAGKKGGEFYTPHEVSVLMGNIIKEEIKEKENVYIYDPTSGSGSLLINTADAIIKKSGNKNHIRFYAQELIQNTYNLTRMNLVMHGVRAEEIYVRNGDTLEDDWPFFKDNDKEHTYSFVPVDVVVSNPPYSQHWDNSDKDIDPRFKDYGIAPPTKADYAFLLHCLYHLKNDGIMTIVLPHGVLFREGEEKKIRENLVLKNNIDTIIGLPDNIFFGTGIPTIIMILKKRSMDKNDVLFIDAKRCYIKEGNKNKLRSEDIKRITDAVLERRDIEKFAKVVSKEEIIENDYNLNIPRYVDSTPKKEKFDLYSLTHGGIPECEIEEMNKYWFVFPSLKEELFLKENNGYYTLKVKEIQSAIENNKDVISFSLKYENTFKEFPLFLKETFINNIENDLSFIGKDEKVVSRLFDLLSSFPLLDKYDVFEEVSKTLKEIENDYSIINIEGFKSLFSTDPNMVIKKNNGNEVEIQEGWRGRIVPFSIVEDKYFLKEKEDIKNKENRLEDIASLYEDSKEEILSLESDNSIVFKDEELTIFKEDGEEFNFKDIAKINKNNLLSGEAKSILLKVQETNNEERKIKKEIKEAEVNLESKIKDKIESLTIKEALLLLEDKWIKPMYEDILSFSKRVKEELLEKVSYLNDKYETTLSDINNKIQECNSLLLTTLDNIVSKEEDVSGLDELKKLLGGK